MADPCETVRSSTRWVMSHSDVLVKVSDVDAYEIVQSLSRSDIMSMYTTKLFDRTIHFVDPERPELTLRYLLVTDSLNFCFWPDPDLQYEHLAEGIKRSVEKDPSCLDPHSLARASAEDVRALLGWSRRLPLEEERARLVREVGRVLLQEYKGTVISLIQQASKSARRLVMLITEKFPGFRDAAIYNGQQVFFYKRAQIFAADVYGAFDGQGPGDLDDIDCLTTFADYRIPQILAELNIMQYHRDLAAILQNEENIAAGSKEEIEIRSATVQAVELLRTKIADSYHEAKGKKPPAVHLDWYLWQLGEARRNSMHCQHHRTLTPYY